MVYCAFTHCKTLGSLKEQAVKVDFCLKKQQSPKKGLANSKILLPWQNWKKENNLPSKTAWGCLQSLHCDKKNSVVKWCSHQVKSNTILLEPQKYASYTSWESYWLLTHIRVYKILGHEGFIIDLSHWLSAWWTKFVVNNNHYFKIKNVLDGLLALPT